MALMDDLTAPKHTKVQLVEVARANGYQATDRLLTDWEAAGLLDQPTKRGRGRGKGIEALWPESQLRLWLLLLQKRQGIGHIATLCNITVSLWMYFGDDYATLRQVKRCMQTWANRYGLSRGHAQAERLAKSILADIPLKGSKKAQVDLVQAIRQVLLHGIRSDEERQRLHDKLLGSIVLSGLGSC